MLEYISFTIDGAVLKVPRGTSVLDAAMEFGICIPHLCHVPTLTDLGACRLCIVEHVRDASSRITASCTLEVQEGMVIRANSGRVTELRRMIAELLVAEAPNSREVQDIAVRCGVKEVRYPFRNNDCVLCGRCVRVCNELWGAKALGFVGRGSQRHVDFPFGRRPDFCKHCGACVDLCTMVHPPCDGYMDPGEERLCGKCESKLWISEEVPASCVWCDMGENFRCARQRQMS